MKSILIATQDKNALNTFENYFKSKRKLIVSADINQVLDILRETQVEFLFIDFNMLLSNDGTDNPAAHLNTCWQLMPELEIIILTDSKNTRQAVSLVRAGASDYLNYPIDTEEVRLIIDKIKRDQKLHLELKYLRNQFWDQEVLGLVQTQNSIMKDVYEKVRAVSPTDTTVLLTGETGTGKGVIANLIHRHSKRNDKPFVQVHCGAISDTLMESELFGHEKGAFTGAHRQKLGKFEIAHSGTIFLDEIATMSPAMQVKILQVLQDRIFHRVGGESTITCDTRIIVATNMDLKKMCEDGLFRRDLYYRLQVFPIEIPSLKERIEDIPLLIKTFLKRLNQHYQKSISEVHPAVLQALLQYDWPGNIRELENLIERAYVIESSHQLTAKSFPNEFFYGPKNGKVPVDTSRKLSFIRKNAIEASERAYLTELLQQYKGKISQTAEAAGIGVRHLHKLMAKYNINKNDFK